MPSVAFIQSCWHKEIVNQFKIAFTKSFKEQQEDEVEIDYLEAPGAVEIPLLEKLCAKKQKYDAIAPGGQAPNATEQIRDVRDRISDRIPHTCSGNVGRSDRFARRL